jgi:predicted lysophospholipase L1 biosynthesis ABC-type transport system permease subunit
MWLSHIAFRNVREHPSRSALLLLVITVTVAVVSVLYLVTRSAERDLADKVDAYGATLAGVRDRRGEIGIFRAIGYRRRHIFSIILIENLALAAIGGLAGVALAGLAAGPLARAVAGVTHALLPGAANLGLALAAAVGVVLVASLYPAWQASRLSPTLAMRRV